MHSTATALRETGEKKAVGAVLLDFTAAFDIIDHELLLKKQECYGFAQSALSWIKSYLTNMTQTLFFLFMGALQMLKL